MTTKKPTPSKKAPAKKPAPKKAAAPVKRAQPRKAKTTSLQAAQKPLAPKVLRFIDEYLIDMNASAAYKRAGYTAKGNSAEVNASRLLRKAQVAQEIATRRDKTAEKLQITREDALESAWLIVKADPRELVEHIVMCCRQCHGIGHAHQWKDAEEFEAASDRAVQDYEQARRKKRDGDPEPVLRMPSDEGGFGFDPRRAPHRDCPGCMGAGIGRTVVKDTRSMSPSALALYAGIKETKEGIEVKMHSKLDALEKVFRHLGMYDADKPPPANVSVSVAAAPANVSNLPPAEAYLVMVQGAKR